MSVINGVVMGGVGLKFASGTATAYDQFLDVSGLGFKPRLVYAKNWNSDRQACAAFDETGGRIGAFTAASTSWASISDVVASVTETGFRIHALDSSNRAYNWYACGQ